LLRVRWDAKGWISVTYVGVGGRFAGHWVDTTDSGTLPPSTRHSLAHLWASPKASQSIPPKGGTCGAPGPVYAVPDLTRGNPYRAALLVA
jgi:hypothetical protein